MRRVGVVLAASFAGAFGLAVAASASADTYTPNLSGSTLDPTLAFTANDPGYTYSLSGGGISVTYNTAGYATPTSSFGGIFGNVPITGNYVAKYTVDFSNFSNSSYPTLINAQVNMLNAGGGTSQVLVTRYGGQPQIQGAVGFPISGGGSTFIGGPAVYDASNIYDVTIQRVGDTSILSYAPGGSSNSTILYAASGPAFQGTSIPLFGIYYNGTAPIANSTAKFSNISVTYGNDPSLPATVSDAIGGTPSNPASLPSGPVNEISGAIGGTNSSDFFKFNWNGGNFSAFTNVPDATDGSSYLFELLNADASLNSEVTLDGSNSFQGAIAEYLAAGQYEIGLATNDPVDPHYFIDFGTPVLGAVPEPAAWSLLILGVAMIGVSARRRRQGLVLAA